MSACMIHNLFDEYRFFAKYPDKELSITAVLFGGLIQRGLVADRCTPWHWLQHACNGCLAQVPNMICHIMLEVALATSMALLDLGPWTLTLCWAGGWIWPCGTCWRL